MIRALGELKDFVALVFEKMGDDNVFFLASGLTFGVLIAAIPFFLLLVSVAGLLLAPQFEAPGGEVLNWLWALIPAAESPELRAEVEDVVADVVGRAGSIGLASGVAFVWFSTRLFGSLRIALGEVFDLKDKPGPLRAKAADVLLVFLATLLLTANIALTSFLMGVGEVGLEMAGLEAGMAYRMLGLTAAFIFLYVMFLLVFKFGALNRIRWSTAAVAALFAAVAFELLKFAFGWFLANLADYSAVFFAFASVIALVIAVYYGCVVFLMGGQVAQVWEMRRTRRRQREAFEE